MQYLVNSMSSEDCYTIIGGGSEQEAPTEQEIRKSLGTVASWRSCLTVHVKKMALFLKSKGRWSRLLSWSCKEKGCLRCWWFVFVLVALGIDVSRLSSGMSCPTTTTCWRNYFWCFGRWCPKLPRTGNFCTRWFWCAMLIARSVLLGVPPCIYILRIYWAPMSMSRGQPSDSFANWRNKSC